MVIVWYIGQSSPTVAVLYAMVYALMWSMILVMTALCYGPGWWRWTNISTYVTIAVGPVIGLWSLVVWLSVSFFVRLLQEDGVDDEW